MPGVARTGGGHCADPAPSSRTSAPPGSVTAAVVRNDKNTRENVHQVCSILFEKEFIISQLAMFDLLLRFDHHRRRTL